MEGLHLGRKGTVLEKVTYDSTDFSLLTQGDGVEIMLQTIEKDKLFYIYPSENPSSIEFYYILSGNIICEVEGATVQELGPHDYIKVKGLGEPVHFKTMSKVVMLTTYTEQTFVHLSKEISALMNVAKEVEKKDRYTALHSTRVSEYSVKVAKALRLNMVQLDNLNIAAYLHDIGKINVPENILNKPGRLTKEEFDTIKKHPADGAEMIKNTYYKDLAPIILQHHERLNGSGYPSGLKGEEISIEARIIAVCDTFDAMTEDRAYRKAFSAKYALEEIKRLVDSHYDRNIVEAFEKVLLEEGAI